MVVVVVVVAYYKLKELSDFIKFPFKNCTTEEENDTAMLEILKYVLI